MRKSNSIKDTIMMPPPRARPKSVSDISSEELRRNLLDSSNNSFDNNFFQEQMSIISKENEELSKYSKESKDIEEQNPTNNNRNNLNNLNNLIDDSLSLKSGETYSYAFQFNEKNNNNIESANKNTSINSVNSPSNFSVNNINNINGNGQNSLNNNINKPNSFNFNMDNYLYDNYENEENNQEYKKHLEKLKNNLTGNHHYNKFEILGIPTNKKEIKLFIYNMEKYIGEHLFDNNLKNMKIILQTRYNDYKNGGLNFDYFMRCLDKMQKELISRIAKHNNGDKKIGDGNFILYIYFIFILSF